MPKPTKAALAKKPKAVVLLAAPVTEPTEVDYDFEWFETDEGVRIFLEDTRKWANEDAAQHGDLIHLIAEVTDTTTMPPTLGSVTAHHKADDNVKGVAEEWFKKVLDDPTLLIAKSATTAKRAAAPKVNTKVKPRKPSPAAAAAKGVKTDNGEAAANAGKAAALKQRIAAKQGAVKDKAEAKPKPPAREKASAKSETVEPMGWALPIGRRRNGQFARLH